MDQYLEGDHFFTVSSEKIKMFVDDALKGEALSETENAIALYYAVRDRIYYNPFKIDLDFENHNSDTVLNYKEGHCIDKAGLLITCLRSIHIPARLGLARVKNHMGTTRLEKILRSNVLVPHGYTEVYLSNSWVKCTPAFNIELCEKLNVSPLEWDGVSDSLFPAYDRDHSLKMEYLEYLGVYAKIPETKIKNWMRTEYPHMFDSNDNWIKTN